jgi:hypothetical protein
MSLFKAGKVNDANSPIPVVPFDTSRRYDLYCWLAAEERHFENVKVICIRALDRITEYSSGAIGGLLEIEAASGARMMIPQHSIHMICEHGTQPVFDILRKMPRR